MASSDDRVSIFQSKFPPKFEPLVHGDLETEAASLPDRARTILPRQELRRFPEKNLPFQKVDAGLITMSYLGNCGSRFNRASTASIATFPSAIPFVYTWRLSSTTG